MSTTTTTKTKASGSEKPTKFVEVWLPLPLLTLLQQSTKTDQPSQHVKKYPTVQKGVTTFQSYPLGKKSVNTLSDYYQAYLSPFLANFKGAYSFIAPYILKADDLADFGLKKVDTTFPIVTKDPEAIKNAVLSYLPLGYFYDTKDYVSSTYTSEYKKTGESIPKAAITTSLVIGSDTLAWISGFVSTKRAQGHDYASETYNKSYTYVNDKKDEALKYTSDSVESAKNLAYVKKEEAKKEAKEAKKSIK